jgi:16S rRNA (guanine527-N7)-methyltransferase
MPTLTEQAAALVQITLTPEQAAQFEEYARLLVEWNQRINLTAISDPDGIQVRHFLDSLTICRVLPMIAGLRLIDVGTGAGFPGLPLKIACPDIEVTLLEATGKKVHFLDEVIAALGLRGVDTLKARAEEAGQMPDRREAYDAALARSVARLPVLLEYLLPLVRVGGRCIAMKGETAAAEIADSRRALAALGGRVLNIETVQLPGVADAHHLVVVEKIAQTPPMYPRKPGMPTQKPL